MCSVLRLRSMFWPSVALPAPRIAPQVRRMSLYSCQASKPLRLEEFDQAQAAATDATANHLRDNWLAAIKHVIKCAARGGGGERA
jgi:hypothetical protein